MANAAARTAEPKPAAPGAGEYPYSPAPGFDPDAPGTGHRWDASLYRQATGSPGYARLSLLVELADAFTEAVGEFLADHDDGCDCPLCRFDRRENHRTAVLDLRHLAYSAEIGVSFCRNFIHVGDRPDVPADAPARLRAIADLLDQAEADAPTVVEGGTR